MKNYKKEFEKIKNMKKDLVFEEKEHRYYFKGELIPSVTQILGKISNKIYEGIDEKILKKASDRGTAVHEAIYQMENFGEYEIDERYIDYMIGYLKFKIDYKDKIQIINSEEIVTNGLYAGTIDCIAIYENKLIIIDYKTTSELHETLVSLQISGYDNLLEHYGIKIDEYYCLHLGKCKYEFKKIRKNKNKFKKMLLEY